MDLSKKRTVQDQDLMQNDVTYGILEQQVANQASKIAQEPKTAQKIV